MKNLLKDTHPHLLTEIHPTKNNDIEISELRTNSSKKLYWQCLVNPKHIFSQSVGNRTQRGHGCPYCSGRRTLPEESFAQLYPDIASELHPTKNQDFDPYSCRPQSNKRVWWKCDNGHEWEQRIDYRIRNNAKCRECRRLENSISIKYPEIASEWHPTKNGQLKPEDVSVSYKEKVWWRCKKDPSHEREVSVRTRVQARTGCRECAKQKREKLSYPPLDEYSPSLAAQWHPTKNGTKKPSDVKPNSSSKVWWLCPKNPTHEWESIVRNRALLGKGCPDCAGSRVTTENSLVVLFPKIAQQWHPTRNGDLKPSDFSYGSHQTVWWKCLINSSHEWQAKITSRTQRNAEICPICKQESNSLQTVYPEIARQWHPTKNEPLKPNQVSRASNRIVWWKCSENPDHEWEAMIKNRTALGTGCQHCAAEKNIIRFSEHLYDLVHTDIDYYHIFLRNMRMLRKIPDYNMGTSSTIAHQFYGMIFTSVITTLEAYLSDAFYKNVVGNDELIEKLIMTNPEFNKKQYSLTEVIDWNKNINKKVTEYLFNIVWHRLAKVQNMYSQILGVNFPNDISHLYKAVAVRHDLVHRNGRKKSGSSHKITKSQVIDLMKDVKEFVAAINKQLEEKNTE